TRMSLRVWLPGWWSAVSQRHQTCNGLLHQWPLHRGIFGLERPAPHIPQEGGFSMVRHSPHTASLCSVLMAALMVSLFLAGGAAAQTNTSLGTGALRNNTTGVLNTAIGFGALGSNTTGISNTASGAEALLNNTTGGSNTASGDSALLNNTTGANN